MCAPCRVWLSARLYDPNTGEHTIPWNIGIAPWHHDPYHPSRFNLSATPSATKVAGPKAAGTGWLSRNPSAKTVRSPHGMKNLGGFIARAQLCDASFPWGKRRLNHHSTVWKMKDAIMNVDDVKYMMIYLGMNIWMMYTPTLNISVYMSICYMYVSRVHNMRNPTSVKRWSIFRIFCRDQLSGYHGICRYTGCRTDW